MIRFFREQKFLAALLVLSFLVILAGLIMIWYTTKKATEAAAAQEAEQVQTTIDTMTVIAGIAEQELQETASNDAPVNPVGDVKPQESLDRVAALNGHIPEVGSDDWCEVMMVKDAKDWTTDEQSLFAKNCI